MKKFHALAGLLLFAISIFIFWQMNSLQQYTCVSYIKQGSSFLQPLNNEGTKEEEMEIKCTKKTALFFLKIHKSASSTVQNILMRFGHHHHLSFVLPEKNNYVGNPEHFSPELIGTSVRLPKDEKYDIFTHHTRYNHDKIRAIMKDGAPFVTIMREPIDLQISLYNYYQLEMIRDFSLPRLLHENLTYLMQLQRLWYRVGWNQISWDLGVSLDDMYNPNTFVNLANKLESEFDLVMITELMEPSLILLADLMCWPLEEVRFISVNVLQSADNTTFKKHNLTEEERSVLEKLNHIDIQLYSHFKERFKQRILAYGAERMISQVNRLNNMNAELYDNCIEKVHKPSSQELALVLYQLKINAPPICKEVVMWEIPFTDKIRLEQKNSIKVRTKLEDFLYN